jgi:hypothetical protein
LNHSAPPINNSVAHSGAIVNGELSRISWTSSKDDARVKRLGLEQFRIAPRSPWQNGYAERFVGTLRRELLDHVIVLGERHLLGLVRQHARYYNEDRPYMSLHGDAPVSRGLEPADLGNVIGLPRVGGLHHRPFRSWFYGVDSQSRVPLEVVANAVRRVLRPASPGLESLLFTSDRDLFCQGR